MRKKKIQVPTENLSSDFQPENKNNDESLNLNSNNEEINKIVEEFKEDSKKENRGRKKKVDKEFEEAEKNFAESMSLSGSIVLNIFISRMKNSTPLNDAESKNFDLAFSQLAKKYFSTVQRFGEEINFIVALSSILITRVDIAKLFDRKKNTTDIRENRNRQNNTGKEDNQLKLFESNSSN